MISIGRICHGVINKIAKIFGIKKVRKIALTRIETKLRKLNFNKNSCKK